MIANRHARRKPGRTLVSDTLHHLNIELKNVKPMIGREVLVPSDIRLDRLNEMIQAGWADSHLHEFIVGTLRDGERFGTPVHDPFASGPPTRNETKFTLRQTAPDKGS